MRRFHVLPISTLAVVATIAAAALAVPAGASRAPAGPKPVKHKAPPVTAVTIAAQPNPSLAGQPVLFSGRVIGTRRAGAPVQLWRKRPRDGRFHLAFQTQADAAGHYAVLVSGSEVNTNTQWYAATHGVSSTTAAQRVKALLTLNSSTTAAAPGETVKLGGHVKPWHAGDHISLQQLSAAGAWTLIAAARINRGSNFSIKYRFTTGLAKLRAMLPADPRNAGSYSKPVAVDVASIHKIKHVVIIMQENRSFDSYFGTYPGADGIPAGRDSASPTRCSGGCVAPFHDSADLNYGGPHGGRDAAADIDGGQMDGFVAQAEQGRLQPNDPRAAPATSGEQCAGAAEQCIDVMGYHDAREIPNYWTYAQDFVLQDHMFEPNASWSLPAHLYMVSEWSAFCTDPTTAYSCRDGAREPESRRRLRRPQRRPSSDYAWTDMTYLLHKRQSAGATTCSRAPSPTARTTRPMTCAPVQQGPKTPGIWNPLPSFNDVNQDGQLGNIQSLQRLLHRRRRGTLPAVSWVVPNGTVSEHPPALVSAGQTYVTGLINAIMRSPDWDSTAIFLSWDDWGGFYDHVVPPAVDQNGYGLRVPGHRDQPVRPARLHRPPDAQPRRLQQVHRGRFPRRCSASTRRPTAGPTRARTCARASPLLGNLVRDFDFNQQPRQGLLLPVHPAPGPASQAPSISRARR